jgi:RNA-directed DNA polymerase
MLSTQLISRQLAEILADGVWTEEEIERRIRKFLGERRKWVVGFATRLFNFYGTERRPTKRQVEAFLALDIHQAEKKNKWKIRLVGSAEPTMRPTAGAPATWDVQPLLHRGELADWLGFDARELNHIADRSYRERQFRSERQRNYRYHWLAKTQRGFSRLIEVPKPRLMQAQRQILYEILDGIPAHAAAHGFRQGRSTLSFVAPHVGQEVVMRMDVQDFFPSIHPTRIAAIFRTAGYPDEVALMLTALCTNVASAEIWDRVPPTETNKSVCRQRGLYDAVHLPQGAPTSPALANLVSFRLDLRLSGLADCLGIQYTRYADDLVFSGKRKALGSAERLKRLVCNIAVAEGLELNLGKTRVMRPGTRQHACGLTLNEHANVSRRDYDRLKATLHNCFRLGPTSQNTDDIPHFRDHLMGRVAYVEAVNPPRGAKLRVVFEKIQW